MTKPKTYFIRTFGCAMNEAESELIAAWYQAQGWQEAKDWQEADEVVINSCSVREAAENRVFGLVNNISKFKTNSTVRGVVPRHSSETTPRRSSLTKPRIILTGCMVGSAKGERKRYSLRELKKRLPQVAEFKPWWEWGFDKIGAFETRKSRKKAFVPIMKGCDNFCTYCVVPYAKGKEISYPMKDIICQIEELAKKGWEHIILLGQNVNSYGKDFSNKEKYHYHESYHGSGSDNKEADWFATLLKRVHKISGIKKISFLTSNPWDLSEEIIGAMKLRKIDRYLHLPAQSGDDEVLKRMNRPYTAVQYIKLVEKIRKAIPDIKIGSDIIVGFPGESKAAFQNTVKLCKKVNFTKAYVAMYSLRPGTAAAKLKDNVSHQEKRRRWRVLDKLIN